MSACINFLPQMFIKFPSMRLPQLKLLHGYMAIGATWQQPQKNNLMLWQQLFLHFFTLLCIANLPPAIISRQAYLPHCNSYATVQQIVLPLGISAVRVEVNELWKIINSRHQQRWVKCMCVCLHFSCNCCVGFGCRFI